MNGLNHAKALAWEYWTRTFVQLLFAFAISLGMTMVVYGMLGLTMETGYGRNPDTRIGAATDVPEGIKMQFGFFWLVLAMAASTVIPALGKPAQRYLLPSKSILLVGVPMLCSIVTTFGFYVAVALVLNAFFDANWLILGPALFAAVAISWMQAVYWSTSNSGGLRAFVGLVSAVGIIAIAGQNMLNGGGTPFLIRELTPLRLVGYVATTGISLAIATLGFSQLRHGQGIPMKRFADRIGSLIPVGNTDVPFASSSTAQFWYEFRHRGFVLPAIAVFISALVLIACLFGETSARMALGVGSILLLVCVSLFGLYLGPRKANGEFGNFFGSRPLTDGQFANAVLKNATIAYVLASLIWALTASVVLFFVSRQSQSGPQPEHETLALDVPLGTVLAIVVTWILGWAAIALISAVTLGGIKQASRLLFSIICWGFLLVAGDSLDNELLHGLIMCLSAAVFATVVVAAFIYAYRRNLISVQRLMLIVVPILVACIATATNDTKRPLVEAAVFTTMAAFISAPLAVAPLSVWWHRHQ